MGLSVRRLRWPRPPALRAGDPRRSFGPVRAHATSNVVPAMLSVASTRTEPKSSNAPARARIIAATGEISGLARPRFRPTRADRVGVTGLRPSPLPHHRTCGFLASGGWRRWTSPQRVHDIRSGEPVNRHSALSLQPSARASLAPPVGSTAGVHRRLLFRGHLIDGLPGAGWATRSPAASLSLCAFGPSLQPLSRPSSLLRPLLTSARLSTGRSPRVRCMDSRAAPPDSTPRAFR